MSVPRLRVASGVNGLDVVLEGGFPPNGAFLVQGAPGAGKTTLCLQFANAAASPEDAALYISTAEAKDEIGAITRTFGLPLQHATVYCFRNDHGVASREQQSVFRPAETELPRTVEELMAVIERHNPARLVLDSLTELRVLAREELWYRRQLLRLLNFLEGRKCTTLLTDDVDQGSCSSRTLVSGVISIEQVPQTYGSDRRRLRVAKLRGQSYLSGYHDYKINSRGVEVYPRLVAADHRAAHDAAVFSTGVQRLDELLGGGVDRGVSLLLMGPTGTGKSSVAAQIVDAAMKRGERAAFFAFDERVHTLLQRCHAIGVNLVGREAQGLLQLQQVDPAELTPGEFAEIVKNRVEQDGCRLVVIDSMNGYFQSMPDERFLMVHLHELLSYLGQKGVTCILILSQQGLPGGGLGSELDISYIADTVILLRHFEYRGTVRKAIAVHKRRAGRHERTIREVEVSSEGIRLGAALTDFQGILTGIPQFIGESLGSGQNGRTE